jgi:ribosomal protein S18 acetylase RimI-like enzyme
MTKNSFEIIKATAEETETIVQFQLAMAQESEGTSLDLERLRKGVSKAMEDTNKGEYLVAKSNGKTIASLMLTKEWSDWNAQWYLWVQSVYVLPEFRRQGVYKTMYEKVKTIAKEQNISQVRLYVDTTNYPAQQTYQRLGMKQTHYLMYEENV